MFLNVDPLGENIEDKINRLISGRKCGPMILVLLDCFTRFGGNQYINSTATGRYEDHIVKEIVPFVDKNYNISTHAVWGKSSGGYGSIVLGMRHPEVFRTTQEMQPLNIATFKTFQKLLMPLEKQADRKSGWIISGKN